jgi:O-antigen/teichoic acid export membrane protein
LPHFLSLYTRERKPALIFGFMIAALVLVILAKAVITVVGIYAVVPMIRNTASHQCLSDGYYLATAMALITLFSVYLTYHKQAMVSSSAGPDGPSYQLVLIGTVLLALLLPHNHTGLLVVEVVASMGVAAAACLAVELAWCLTGIERAGGARPSFRLREWLLESLPVGGSAILGTLIYSADIIAVRLVAGSESAAAYAVASSLATFVIIPRTATGTYFSQEAPHVEGAERAASCST